MTTTHDDPSTTPTRHRYPAAGPTSRTATSKGARFSAAGPAANLVELPVSTGEALAAPADVDAHLGQVEAARQRQLDEMASTNLDAVAAAYRATVERILVEVRTARHRVMLGLYGLCTGCAEHISSARLQLRPWTTTCATCAPLDRR